jgi:hypothetical protein
MHPRLSSETPLQFPGSTPPQDLKTTTVLMGRRIAIFPPRLLGTRQAREELRLLCGLRLRFVAHDNLPEPIMQDLFLGGAS